MTNMIFQFLLAAIMIVLAALWLAKSSDEIARRTGLGHLFVGSLFLAAATSAPEFFVDIRATIEGIPNLAAGDLLGANLVNLLILACLSLWYRQTLAKDPPRGIFFSSFLPLLLVAEVALLILVRPPFQMFGLNFGSILLLATYFLGMRFVFHKTRLVTAEGETAPRGKSLARPMVRFFAGAAVIFFASPLMVRSAEQIAHTTGLGNSFIGTTLLAVTTTFPELSSSIAAARMGHFELVLGNLLGSNAFNMLIFVVMDGLWTQSNLWEVLSHKHLVTAVAVLLNTLLFIIAWRWVRKPVFRIMILILTIVVTFGCYFVLYLVKNS